MKNIITAILFLILSTNAFAESKIYETLEFNKFNDPGWMKLTRPNGEQVTADFYYSLIEYEDISEWETGESIEVSLSDTDGVLIRRLKTDRVYLVIFNDGYPIDNRMSDCLKEDYPSTLKIAQCNEKATYYWDAYADTLLQFLYSINDIEFVTELQKETEAWNVLVDRRSSAISAYISYLMKEGLYGTKQTINSADDSRLEAQYRFSTLVRYLK